MSQQQDARKQDQRLLAGFHEALARSFARCRDRADRPRRRGGKDTVLTIHDMRSLLRCIQFVLRTAVQTAAHVITTGALIALLTGIAMKMRWFGPNRTPPRRAA